MAVSTPPPLSSIVLLFHWGGLNSTGVGSRALEIVSLSKHLNAFISSTLLNESSTHSTFDVLLTIRLAGDALSGTTSLASSLAASLMEEAIVRRLTL